jgi:hypothetical protein
MGTEVTLECKAMGEQPGNEVDQEVGFIAKAKGYRVWGRWEGGPRKQLKSSSGMLTWRQMVSDLSELNNRIDSCFLEHVLIWGIAGHEADLLKLAWCFDRPFEAQFRFLLQLKDDTLARIDACLGDLSDEKVLNAVGHVVDAAAENFVPVGVMEEGIIRLAPAVTKGRHAWVQAMRAWARKHQPPGPSESDIAQIDSARLSAIVAGPSPSNAAVGAVFLRYWLDSDPKPELPGKVDGVHCHSTAVLLHWIVRRTGPGSFKYLDSEDRETARRFSESFLAHAATRIDWYDNCGGTGFARGCAGRLARDWEDLRLRVLGKRRLFNISSARTPDNVGDP